MKKLFVSILISLICVLSNIIFAAESITVIKSNKLSSPEAHAQKNISFGKEEGSVKTINIPLIEINKQKRESNGIELESVDQESWLTSDMEPVINYNFIPPTINNKIYYNGKYKLEVDSGLMKILSGVSNIDNISEILDIYVSTYIVTTDKMQYIINKELKKFERERRLEAKINLIWLSLLILSLIFIIIYQEEDYIRNPLVLISIASLIFTILNLPDIIILFKGIDYSVLNSLGR